LIDSSKHIGQSFSDRKDEDVEIVEVVEVVDVVATSKDV